MAQKNAQCVVAPDPVEPDENPQMLHPREAADMLGINERKLAAMRKRREGPPWVQHAWNVIVYRRSGILAYIRNKERMSLCKHLIDPAGVCARCGAKLKN